MPQEKTECDFNCLECSLSDCTRSTRDVSSQPKKRRSNAELKERYGANSIKYSALRHIPEPDYTIGLVTKTMDRDELEIMLAREYGNKLEPVRRDAHGKGRKAKANAGGC